MTVEAEDYRQRAAQCTCAAEMATLANERDKFLRAAEAWIELAEKVDKMRAQRKATFSTGG